MLPNPQFSANLVTFTEEILNGKLHFLCSVMMIIMIKIRKIFQADLKVLSKMMVINGFSDNDCNNSVWKTLMVLPKL